MAERSLLLGAHTTGTEKTLSRCEERADMETCSEEQAEAKKKTISERKEKRKNSLHSEQQHSMCTSPEDFL